jgi:putative protein kinase ArgK-like GTPase of G3E family
MSEDSHEYVQLDDESTERLVDKIATKVKGVKETSEQAEAREDEILGAITDLIDSAVQEKVTEVAAAKQQQQELDVLIDEATSEAAANPIEGFNEILRAAYGKRREQ